MKRVIIFGCDGYIGNAITQRLLFKGFDVIGVDNLSRRSLVEKEMGSYSAIPIKSMLEKLVIFRKIGRFTFYNYDVATDFTAVSELLAEVVPDTVINLAHIPSGPYSLKSHHNANFTLHNNIIGTNNLLWAIKKHCPDAHYITIGTTGEYDHYSNIDIEEGYITMNHNGRTSVEMIYPRRPGSIYHCSKTASTYLIDFLARSWGIRCTDVQQAVVFGSYTDDIEQTKVYSRLDSDEAFGTVINRFIVQSVLGEPLTIYGEGNHKRGLISLNDSVQALEIAVNNPAGVDKPQVWNQLSEWHSINELAIIVKEVMLEKGVDVSFQNIDTPRNEQTSDHYYRYVTEKLARLGYLKSREIYQEVSYVIDLLDKDHIEGLKEVVLPKISWK